MHSMLTNMRRLDLVSLEKLTLSLSRLGMEPGTFGFEVHHSIHLAMEAYIRFGNSFVQYYLILPQDFDGGSL